jgi:ATP-dependent Clp protease ATP-binding subunit ClpX
MILEEMMLDLMYYLPSNRKIREFVITREMVLTHELTLNLLEKAG